MSFDLEHPDKESHAVPVDQDTGVTSLTKCTITPQVDTPLHEQFSPTASNSKNTVEWVKNHVITTSKLMKQLEMATLESKTRKAEACRLTDTLASRIAENTRLKEELASIKATVIDMQQTLSQWSSDVESATMTKNIQTNAVLAWRQSAAAKDLLSSREMYIKQMEAQLENLESQFLAPDDQSQKRRRRSSTLLERKEKQIVELEQQIATIRQKQKSIHEDKANTDASHKALRMNNQRLMQQLKTQQGLHRSEFADKEQQQRQISMNANMGTTLSSELKHSRQKLQQNHTHIKYLENEVGRLKNIGDPTGFIEEFKQCLLENEASKKEKRILQDRLTELLVINDFNEKSKQRSLLKRHEFDVLAALHPSDVYDSREQLGTTTEQNSIHHQTGQPSLEKVASGQHSVYQKYSNQPTLPPTTRKRKSKAVIDDNDRPMLHNTTTSSTQALVQQHRPPKNDFLSGSASVSSSPTASPSSSRNSSPSSPSSTDTDEDADLKHLPSLSDMAFARKKIPVKLIANQGHVEHTKPQPSDPPSNIPLTDTSMGSTALQAADIATNSPADIHKSLLCRPSFNALEMDSLLDSLNILFQKWNSPGVPIDELRSGLQTTIKVCTHGVENQSNIKGCPNYFAIHEKNVAWALWALISHYPKNGHYSKVVKWATYNALKSMIDGRGNLACRYIRLMVLLCKNANDKQWVLHFCCDVVRQAPKDANIMSPLLNVALTWPGLLTFDGTDESNLVNQTIQQCCAHYCKSTQPANKRDIIYAYIAPLESWPELQQTTPLLSHINNLKRILLSTYFRNLRDTNRNAFDCLRSNLVKSLDISYWRLNDWKAVYHGFILADLWPLMNDKDLSFTSIELIGLLTRCGLPKPESKKPPKPGVTLIQNTFMDLLENGNDCINEDFPSQCLLANYLVWMAPRTSGIGDVVVGWYDSLKPPFVNKVASDLVFGIEELRSRQ